MLSRSSAPVSCHGAVLPQSPRRSALHAPPSARRPCRGRWDWARFFPPPNGALLIAPSIAVDVHTAQSGRELATGTRFAAPRRSRLHSLDQPRAVAPTKAMGVRMHRQTATAHRKCEIPSSSIIWRPLTALVLRQGSIEQIELDSLNGLKLISSLNPWPPVQPFLSYVETVQCI